MSAWATAALPWFQIGGTIFTAVAAIAAAVSARAALLTAGKADETSRRAVEALGRATKPLLSVRLFGESSRSRDPVSSSITLDISNNGANRGWLLQATARRSDGPVATTTVPMPVEIGSTAIDYEPNYALSLPLGELPRLTTDPCVDGDSDVIVTTEVDFTDISRLVIWRQRARWQERVQIQPDGRPTFSYVRLDSSEPEIISGLPRSESRPVGWVRRVWHRVWQQRRLGVLTAAPMPGHRGGSGRRRG